MKKNKSEDKAFWKIAADNQKEVEKWPKWKRSLKITSKTASTGEFFL